MLRPRPPRVLLAAALLVGFFGPGALTAQEAGPVSPEDSLRAVRVGAGSADGEDPIEVDGLLREAAWSRAGPATGFRQREPDVGDPASDRTEIRVLYDDHAIYVGVRALHRNPERVTSRILQRDAVMSYEQGRGRLRFAGDDGVAILFDPFHDHRNAVVFATNPNGAQFEALVTDEGRQINVDWRSVWRVEAHRTEEGWSAEFAIPFETLRYPDDAGGRPWGFNAFRIVQSNREQTLWRSWSREGGGFSRVSRAGHLVGLRDLPRRGINIQAEPYALGGVSQSRSDAGELPTDGTGDVGLDLKAEPRPGLVLDLTYNTDFAQVEVDEVQVNLTRFSLFFPEKRDFFLENAGVFDFGQSGDPFEPPPFLLFFSRRIGIDDGDEVPIIGGGRLTGRLGNGTLGLMNVTTDDIRGLPVENFAVARYKRDVGENSYVGGMLTDRRSTDGHNTAGGLDGTYWFGDRLSFQGFFAGSESSGSLVSEDEDERAESTGEGHAFRGALRYDGDRYGFEVQHLTVSPDMRAASGFITRKGMRRSDGFFRFTPRPDVLGLRRIDIFTPVEVIVDTDGSLLDWRTGNFFSFNWDSGEQFTAFYNVARLTVEESFELADSIPVEPGEYDASFAGFFMNTSRSRQVFLESRLRVEEAFGGHQYSFGGTLTVQPSPHFSLAVGHTRNRVDVPGGEFTADISRLRADVAFSTDLFTNLLVQYNSLTRDVLTNLRLNFIHSPGSDLFVVLTEERGSPDDIWRTQDRGLVAKLTYLIRF